MKSEGILGEKCEMLPKKIIGSGPTKGFKFEQVYADEKIYIYERKNSSKPYFEVFLRKRVKKCIDFAKRIYSETEFKEVYPKSRDFGNWAFCCGSVESAKKKF